MSTTATATRKPYTFPYTPEERETHATEYGRKSYTIWAGQRWSGIMTATYWCIRRGEYIVIDHRTCDRLHKNCTTHDFKSLKKAREFAYSIG